MEPTKARQIRVYLRGKEAEMLDELCERTAMKDTAVLSLICAAGLRAAADIDYKVPLALKFRVCDGGPLQSSRR